GGSPGTTPRPTPGLPPAGGSRAGSERDDRHRPAAYLHSGEHGREIVGDLPLVGPSVLGDWSARAATSAAAGVAAPTTGSGTGSPGPSEPAVRSGDTPENSSTTDDSGFGPTESELTRERRD
ncbi:MAG: hypothetical protein QM662_17415, partial [Gordonia sp. (in: high G+C Gram-positive bacteria)]